MPESGEVLTSLNELIEVLEGLPMTFRTMRRVRGVSLRQCEKETGVGFNTLSRFERGITRKTGLATPSLIAICRWLEAPTDRSKGDPRK